MLIRKKNKISKEEQNNELIIHHNNLIEAKYNLTLQEKRLILLMSSRIQKEDKEFHTYDFSVQEICTFLHLNNKNIYKEIDNVVSKLFNRMLVIKNSIENSTTKISWLTYAKYWHGQGLIQLKFNEDLKPYMLQIKDRFTKVSLGDVLGLKSVHAIRIYELLKQYESTGRRELSLTDLREYCGIGKDKYERFNDFKRKVLEAAKREINNKTDLLIDYEEIKPSRKITSINFKIKNNPNYGITEFEKMQKEKAEIIRKELGSKNALIEKVIEYGFSRQTSKKLVDQGTEQEINDAIKSVDLQVSRGHVKNPKAMLKTAIEERWKPDVFVSRKKK
jgi:plasmid replication initiation protein